MSRKYLFVLTLIVISILLVHIHYAILSIGHCMMNQESTPMIYKVILMNDRQSFYKLATFDGRKPYADGNRAQATVIKHLRLVKRCQNDSSLIVVDVGAYLGNYLCFVITKKARFSSGDFGLYAAACGCQVYIFEVQPDMIDIIQSSIISNKFPSSRVHVINKAASDLPSNSSMKFSLARGSTTAQNGSLTLTTIRLDDVQWPPKSKILLLKIDVESFELNVLRSAERLFHEQRIEHVIFEYTAFWTDRAAQQELLPYVINNLHPKQRCLWTFNTRDTR